MIIIVVLILLAIVCGRAYWKASDSPQKETTKKAFANLKRSKTFWIVLALLIIVIIGRIIGMMLDAAAKSQAVMMGY